MFELNTSVRKVSFGIHSELFQGLGRSRCLPEPNSDQAARLPLEGAGALVLHGEGKRKVVANVR